MTRMQTGSEDLLPKFLKHTRATNKQKVKVQFLNSRDGQSGRFKNESMASFIVERWPSKAVRRRHSQSITSDVQFGAAYVFDAFLRVYTFDDSRSSLLF